MEKSRTGWPLFAGWKLRGMGMMPGYVFFVFLFLPEQWGRGIKLSHDGLEYDKSVAG